MREPILLPTSVHPAIPMYLTTMPQQPARRGPVGSSEGEREACGGPLSGSVPPSDEEATLVFRREPAEDRSMWAALEAAAGRSQAEGSERLAGRYELRALCGTGAMGEVYEAYDAVLDRHVAVKIIHRHRRYARSADSRRLLREARALARVSHPNVIALYDVGLSSDETFFSMELVRGRTLRAWLREAPRSLMEILTAFLSAGEGLAATHAAGLVHRDFKPTNVLVGEDGRVRLIDFGLACDPTSGASTGGARDGGPASCAGVSELGNVAGTPGFLAPEQILGCGVGPAADQFAFCVSLYQALYGKRPFAGDSPAEMAIATVNGLLQPVAPDARVPERLRRALLRGLSISAEQRFPSMAPLLDELHTCLAIAAQGEEASWPRCPPPEASDASSPLSGSAERGATGDETEDTPTLSSIVTSWRARQGRSSGARADMAVSSARW